MKKKPQKKRFRNQNDCKPIETMEKQKQFVFCVLNDTQTQNWKRCLWWSCHLFVLLLILIVVGFVVTVVVLILVH